MSHNKLEIAGQTPNSNGVVTVNLNHLNDIGTIEDDLVLQYYANDYEWRTGRVRVTNKTLYYNWRKGSATDFGTGFDYTNTTPFHWIVNTSFSFTQYRDSSITVNTTGSYATSLTLGTAGTYLFVASCAIGYFDGKGGDESIDIQWSDGTAFGSKGTVFAGYQKGSIIWGVKTVSANANVFIDITNAQSSPNAAESEQSTAVSVCIFKI